MAKDPYAENARLRRFLGQALDALERQPTHPGGLPMGRTPWAARARELLAEEPPKRSPEEQPGNGTVQAALEV